MLEKALKLLKRNSLAVLLILVGSATWSATMVKSGLIYKYGMGFWGPNGHDGIWHIALIKSLAKGSWDMPVFAGSALQNYHVGYDLLLAVLSRLTGINPITLYFQVFPVVLALLIGILTYKLVFSWKGSKPQALWATFFVYFGGSFGWIVNLLRKAELGGESMFWAQQGISTLVNPPFALSLVLLLLGIILLLKKKKNTWDFLLTVIVFGVLIQVKAYAGILVLGALALAGVYKFVRKEGKDILLVSAGSAILSLVLFLPLNKEAGSLLVFRPFWFLETMMGLSDRVGWDRFFSAMTNWRLGNIWIKAVPAYIVAFAIFWFGNLGTRVIKEILVLRWLKNLKKLEWMEVFFAAMIVAGAALPMFFLQEGTPWNTIQFVYYSLFASGILAGVILGELTERFGGYKAWAISLTIILLTIPTTIGTLQHYLPSRPPSMIPTGELEALEFLSSQPDGVVLTYPFDKDKAKAAEANPPRPLYLYESTAYVSALTGKSVYLEDEVNLDITGYPWRQRRDEVVGFLQSMEYRLVRAFPRENNITYVYWLKGQRATLGEGQIGMRRIFENSLVEIFKVD